MEALNAKEDQTRKGKEEKYASSDLFIGLDNPFVATRYHSLVC